VIFVSLITFHLSCPDSLVNTELDVDADADEQVQSFSVQNLMLDIW